MRMHRRPTRGSAVGAALGLVLGVMGVLVAAGPAQAHNYVVSTNPEAGTVVTEQPGAVGITTNDALLEAGGDGNTIQISGPGGAYYGDGCTLVDGPTASMQAVLGEPGQYTVVWQVVSTDGHPVSGQFDFSWQPAEGQDLAEPSAEPPVCGGQSAPGTAPDATGQPDEASSAPPEGAQTARPTEPAGAGQDNDAATAVGVVVGIGSALAVLAIAAVIVVLVSRRRSKRSPGESAGSADDDHRSGPSPE
ncbi:hypothetical protein GCM10027416_00120 [Okibacterium endophyticum]